MSNSSLLAILLPTLSYLIGAVPFGLIVVRRLADTDIRTIGSGNIGATNARRAAGTRGALLVLICDCLKGLLPVLSVRYLMAAHAVSPGHLILTAMVLTAVIGHMFPVYLGFKPSGKGVATALGGFLAITPLAAGVCLAVFVSLAAATRRISVGSLAGVATLPLTIWLTTHDPVFAVGGFIAAVLIVARHKDNLSRLLKGKEPPFK